ncbi:2-dehydro-3-deoxygalactonokinase [Sphingomonas changbaiensis NBRC 104936]|uniref:2-dehydro-3-deoxygalactonokinase n=1 Tax=Sphingomonas changbaiensis NBRC 104936 TaxID=1219043 RepID=A0A0E9MKG5_9SPHN|nr:2-dehydro-3-deoxygalactonokinase [Sphingomonas changbaiensis]GAO38029.1 2-dehydro-3-deoxygalactonokinase [Sphingomonas changbaiensis NBRC 104936]
MAGRFDWSDGFIAVDWGTTNRRAWAVAANGETRELLDDGLGVLKVEPGGFPSEIAALRQQHGDRPILLAGMIGSNRGWIEAAYVPAPATLDGIVDAMRWPEDGVCIVPGVSYRYGRDADVMRGEEVQIFGGLAAGLQPDGLLCHPGTHAKWVRLQGRAIGPFRTVMTGELFSTLSRHGILMDRLQGKVVPNDNFRAGAEHGLGCDDLTAELFSIRARYLLNVGACDDASYASGLLIGADVRIGLAFGGEGPVALVGRPDLTALYAEALSLAGREARQIDGERAFLLGARAIAERLT